MNRACAAHCPDLQLCSPVVAAPIVTNPVTELASGNSMIKTDDAIESQKSEIQSMLCHTVWQSALGWAPTWQALWAARPALKFCIRNQPNVVSAAICLSSPGRRLHVRQQPCAYAIM